MFFLLYDTPTTEIYTLSLHDALPISMPGRLSSTLERGWAKKRSSSSWSSSAMRSLRPSALRSEEHTSELQSQSNLVCRLLLEKKNKNPHSLPRTHLVCAIVSATCTPT